MSVVLTVIEMAVVIGLAGVGLAIFGSVVAGIIKNSAHRKHA